MKIQAQFQQALALMNSRDFEKSRAMCEDILRRFPQHSDSLYLLGLIAFQTNAYQSSVDWIDRAISINPNNAYFHCHRAHALGRLNRQEEAIVAFNKAIVLKPDFAEAYSSRGDALMTLHRYDEAVECFEKAVAINPNFLEALSHLGIALAETDKIDASIESFNRALAINPKFTGALLNRAKALAEQLKLDAAVESIDTAFAINPNLPEGRYSKALFLLQGGHYEKGWEAHEGRWQTASMKIGIRNFTAHQWSGKESLAGKTILLNGEQGFGDVIQFCRYAKLVADLGAYVILEAYEALVAPLRRLDGVREVFIRGKPLPPFDYYCPLMSLPFVFKTRVETIPFSRGYLDSDPAKVAFWKNRLGNRTKPLIGIVWRCGKLRDRKRTIALSEMMAQLPKDFQYVSLQREVPDEERPTLQSYPNILHLGDDLYDFSDTAALCTLMDLVISVDTSVVHLSGALSKPTWVPLAYSPDWRWLLGRDDSPWYDSVKLYRQETRGDWTTVFANISADLTKRYTTNGG